MKLIILLSTTIIVHAGVVTEKYCDEVLKEDIDRPYLLAIDRSNDLLYFSYSVLKDSGVFKTARINLHTREFKDIDDVNNGFAQTVDAKTNDVYIGGSDGLYKYDYQTHKSEFIGEKDVDIWTVFYKDILYYSVFPSQFFYTFSNGESTRFVDLQDTKVDHFIIDGADDIFFTNGTGLYQQKKGTNDAVEYVDLPENGARGMSMDAKGLVHICFQDGIYSVKKETHTLEQVAKVNDTFGVAFDSHNNMIYSDATKLVRRLRNVDCKK